MTMKKYTISSNVSDQFNISESNAQWTIAKGVTVSAGDGFYGINEQGALSSNSFVIKGTVESDAVTGGGMYLGGSGDVVTIAGSGVVSGSFSLSLQGAGQTVNNAGLLDGQVLIGAGHHDITNTGTIKTTGIAISWSGDDVAFSNDGTVSGGMIAIQLTNSTTTVTLGDNSIVSGKYGIERINDAGLASTTVNNGTITGTNQSFTGDEGNETVVNHGKMAGEIRLYGGNDVFDNRDGTFAGKVSGGDGNDVYYVNSQKIVVVEYTNAVDSKDTVNTTVSYALTSGYDVEKLVLLGTKNINGTGDATDNTIIGNSGANRLSGMQGADTLTGKGGADTFVFAAGFGHDIVTDYKDGTDRIDLSGATGITSFSDLKAHHLSFEDGGAMISNGSDSLFIDHVTKGTLDKSDFVF
jgi:Ca2+-binding RTX toxin-like protein